MKKIVIDPRVIKHLGRDLITSPEVAVIELVKNSIDAKAKHINLRLYNNYSHYESLPNYVRAAIPKQYLDLPMLIVEDDGRGMTNAALDDGFLKIATDIKTNEEGTLGEKGIGRLATQRLGTALLVETSSVEESQTSYVFIDWNDVINGVEEVPNFEGPATPHHTRLIIFNVNLEDYIDNAMQFEQLSLDNSNVQVQINRELKSALNFLISPFDNSKETLPIPQLRFYFDDYEIDITFPYDILSLAESIHSFRFESKQNGILSYGLDIKPWFIERVHRALVKADAFNRLKKPHDFYRDMLERNSIRIENTLKTTATKEELKDLFVSILSDFYAVTEDEQKKEFFDSFIEKKPFQTINLIRQEDTSLPVLFNKKETGEYLSFRSVPIPGKNNRKDWCWIIDVSELNRILESLGLPILLKTDQEVILKNDNAELNLELGKKVQIVKARKKVYLETY